MASKLGGGSTRVLSPFFITSELSCSSQLVTKEAKPVKKRSVSAASQLAKSLVGGADVIFLVFEKVIIVCELFFPHPV